MAMGAAPPTMLGAAPRDEHTDQDNHDNHRSDPNVRLDAWMEKPMDSNLSAIVIDLVAIIMIAIIIRLSMERSAQSKAWRRIAEERRWNWEQWAGAGSEDPNAAEPRTTLTRPLPQVRSTADSARTVRL